jgi:hypothetical protein
VSNIPRMAAKFADPDGENRRARGLELLDMVRQHTYASVMRRANLKRHLEACRKCRPDRTCGEARALAGKVAECLNAIGDCHEQLGQLDADQADAEAQERSPVAVSGTLEMF